MIHTLSDLFFRRARVTASSVRGVLAANPDRGAPRTHAHTADDRPHVASPHANGEAFASDWDLVNDAAELRRAGGEILHLFGEVFDINGVPVAGARVEIWQCDLTGRYVQSATDEGRRGSSAFVGFGAATTAIDGSYRFRTIKPVAYPGRAPHIHARIVRPNGRDLVTEIYLLDAPANRRDWVYQSLGPIGQTASSIDPVIGAEGDLWAGFNFVV